ncbi:hypothetical protein HD553DRAFT_324360 [Filobasidium floriforme]|uniref:uncharacterized protein n=1 Tax=Filobasidium floriforme TaxID=5210 RepID=UPI001E8D9C69|nr:uncharacterized protein HD553DRAFT_324360 [Filobasidium floriforme]KAH8084253.1 hypothetical protein HD553DRAFT_324360 [Filobasidium floriforme]
MSTPPSYFTRTHSSSLSNDVETLLWDGSVYTAASTRRETESPPGHDTTQPSELEGTRIIRLPLYTYWLTGNTAHFTFKQGLRTTSLVCDHITGTERRFTSERFEKKCVDKRQLCLFFVRLILDTTKMCEDRQTDESMAWLVAIDVFLKAVSWKQLLQAASISIGLQDTAKAGDKCRWEHVALNGDPYIKKEPPRNCLAWPDRCRYTSAYEAAYLQNIVYLSLPGLRFEQNSTRSAPMIFLPTDAVEVNVTFREADKGGAVSAVERYIVRAMSFSEILEVILFETFDPQLTYRCPSSFIQASISSIIDSEKILSVQETVTEQYNDDESSINRWSFTPAHVETELPDREGLQVLFMYECKPSLEGRDDAVAALLVFWPGQIEPTRHELRLSKFAGESYVEAFRNELNRDYCFDRYSRNDPKISGFLGKLWHSADASIFICLDDRLEDGTWTDTPSTRIRLDMTKSTSGGREGDAVP